MIAAGSGSERSRRFEHNSKCMISRVIPYLWIDLVRQVPTVAPEIAPCDGHGCSVRVS